MRRIGFSWKLLLILLINNLFIATSAPATSTLWSYFSHLLPFQQTNTDNKNNDATSIILSSPVSASTEGSQDYEIQVIDNELRNNNNNNMIEVNMKIDQDELQSTDTRVQVEKLTDSPQMDEMIAKIPSAVESSDASFPPPPSSLSLMNDTQIELIIQEAERLILADSYPDAINLLLTIIELNQTNQKVNSMLGFCFLTIDQPNVAENFLYLAIQESNYTDYNAIINFIEALKVTEKYDLATSFLLHLKSLPETIITNLEGASGYPINYLLGTIYEYKKEYSTAQEWYLSAAIQRVDNPSAWLRASTLLFPVDYKNLTLAELILLQAIKYNPTNDELLFNLGSLLHATNRILEAKVLYEETLRLNPNMTSALANLATVLHTIGQLSQAKIYYERAIQLSTNNTILLVNYALCLSNLKYHTAASHAIEQASLLDPTDTSIQTDKKKIEMLLQNERQMKENLLNNINKLFITRNFDEIINSLMNYGEPQEDASWWYYTMGIVEYLRKQYQNSIHYCTIANTMTNEQSLLINSCLGLSYQSSGLYFNSNKYFEKSYQLINVTEIMPSYIFNITTHDIQYNLLQSYSSSSQFHHCVTAACEMFHLPSPGEGGIVLLAFSYVKWSTTGEEKINNYQKQNNEIKSDNENERKNKIQIHAGKLMSEEVTRVQALPKVLLNTAYNCLQQLNPQDHSEFFNLRKEAFLELNSLATTPPTTSSEKSIDHSVPESLPLDVNAPTLSNEETSSIPLKNETTTPKLILISSFFFPSHVITSLDRQISVFLQHSLQSNLNNPLIDEILLINQIEYNFSKLANSHKIKQFILPRRVRYSDLFSLANEVVSVNDLVVFASCDIIFDSTIAQIKHNSIFHNNHNNSLVSNLIHNDNKHTSNEPLLLALTAWSTVSTNSNLFTLSIRIDKQDAWILKPPIPSQIITLSDFTLNSKKSDNRLANIFMNAGYRIFNPAFTIRAIQGDPSIRNHTLFLNADVAFGAYSDVFFSDSGIFI